MTYLLRFLNAADPTASLRHAAYALVVCASCGWLSYSILFHGMNANWVGAFGLLLAAVVTGKVVGVAAPSAPDGVAVVSGSDASAMDRGH